MAKFTELNETDLIAVSGGNDDDQRYLNRTAEIPENGELMGRLIPAVPGE